MSKSLSREVIEDIMTFEYQERFHLSDEQIDNTPWERIERAHYIWSLRDKRVINERRKDEIASRITRK